jgi:hypothetical protein
MSKPLANFRYSGDQEDKEWLAKNQLMTTTGGKAYLMVLDDILELAQSPDYASHPRQQPAELVGFHVPGFMIAKMRCFVKLVCTDSALSDEDLLKQAEVQIANWEAERKKFTSSTSALTSSTSSSAMTNALAYTTTVTSDAASGIVGRYSVIISITNYCDELLDKETGFARLEIR